MVPTLSLWLPILLSAILVFIVSSIIHMVLPYHRSDFKRVSAEDDVQEALRKFDIPPGEYYMPHAGSPKEMGTPEYLEKMKKGPVVFMTVLPSGPPTMGQSLIQWFIYSLLVGFLAAYIAGRALEPGAGYLYVFRFVGVTAFVGYAVALWQNSIWYKRSLSNTLKSTFDGFIYACVTAGTFGWLWPN
jgi:hypothetical protein